MCSPLTIAMKLASSPSQEFLDHDRVAGRAELTGEHRLRAARSASSVVSQMMTPLPAASPSAFTTSGARCARTQAAIEVRLA